MGKGRKSSEYQNDVATAIADSLKQEVPKEVFMTGKLNSFIMAKAEKLGVFPTMLLPSMLAAIANVTNMSKFELTKGWSTTCNIFILVVANKGGGKTPSSAVFLKPLLELEKKEKLEFDRNQYMDEESEGEGSGSKAKKRKMEGGDDAAEETDEESSLFHMKQRCVDGITPEALILQLRSSKVLMIKTDEFKGFYDKYVVGAQNVSALASAHSGEAISYTTVKRGGVTIYENRLTLTGCVQAGPLYEMVNGLGSNHEDHQGLFDRILLIPSGTDHDTDFDKQLEDMDEDINFDVDKFLSVINDQHIEARTYKCSKDGLEEIKRVKSEIKVIDRAANYGNETTGMTAKCFTNLLKLCPIYSCGRQVVEMMEEGREDQEILMEVNKSDVSAAWEVVKLSMFTYIQFKTALKDEQPKDADDDENLLEDDEITEALIISGLKKISRIYELSKEGRILISVLKKYSLYPKIERVNLGVFLRALEKFGIGRKVSPGTQPAVKTDTLILTMQTEDEDIVRTFNILYDLAKNQNLRFDPLGRFDT